MRRLLAFALPLLTTGCGLLSGLSDLEIVDCSSNCDASVTPDDDAPPSGALDAGDVATEGALSDDAPRENDVQADKTSPADRIAADESQCDRAFVGDVGSEPNDVALHDVALDVMADVKSEPRIDRGCVGGSPGVYDMGGNLWEWEDACDGQSGATDGCLIRGGSFAYSGASYGPCVTHSGMQRAGGFVDTGFRCCGP